jgi:hypothetical protein
MPINPLWSTRYTRLWIKDADGLLSYCHRIAVEDLEFWTPLGGEWTCTFCGTGNHGFENCKGCSAPQGSNQGRGTALLIIPLPDEIDILSKKRTFDLLVQLGTCGRPDDFIEEDTVIRMSNCGILNAWIFKAVILGPDDEELLTLHIKIGCDIELVRKVNN